MNELIPTIVVVLFGAAPIAAWAVRLPAVDQRAALRGLALHLGAVAAQVVIVRYYYGYGDMMAYHRTGAWLADLMRADFGRYAPEVWKLLWQLENYLVDVHGNGGTTGSMRAISAFLCFFLSDSLWAACTAVSLVAFTGQFATYLALRRSFPDAYARRLAWVALYFPSVVFWTGGLLKETIAMSGLGWAFWGFVQGALHRRMQGAAVVAVIAGAAAMGIIKPFYLFGFAASASVAFYAAEGIRRGRPLRILESPGRLAVAGILMVISVGILGELFPEYSLSNVADEVSHMREAGLAHPGGSTLPIEGTVRRGIVGQVAFIPIGLASALARPLLIEVRNPMMLLTAIEMTVILIGVIRVFRRRKLWKILDIVRSHPVLLFSVIFVLILGTGIGIATVNLGTLARYRVPILPFYGLLVAALLPLAAKRRTTR